MKTLALALVLATSQALAGVHSVPIPQSHEPALAALVSKHNAARAARLADLNATRFAVLARINLQRDKVLPALDGTESAELAKVGIFETLHPLTAAEAGLLPLTPAEYLASLVAPTLEAEAKALTDSADKDATAAALNAVRAIKLRSVDCSDKATTAGLDPLKVCAK